MGDNQSLRPWVRRLRQLFIGSVRWLPKPLKCIGTTLEKLMIFGERTRIFVEQVWIFGERTMIFVEQVWIFGERTRIFVEHSRVLKAPTEWLTG